MGYKVRVWFSVQYQVYIMQQECTDTDLKRNTKVSLCFIEMK